MQSGIYEIRFPSGKRYIGCSKNVVKRWAQHRQQLVKGCHSVRNMQFEFDRCGLARVAFGVLELCDESQLVAREYAHLQAAPAHSLYNERVPTPRVTDENRRRFVPQTRTHALAPIRPARCTDLTVSARTTDAFAELNWRERLSIISRAAARRRTDEFTGPRKPPPSGWPYVKRSGTHWCATYNVDDIKFHRSGFDSAGAAYAALRRWLETAGTDHRIN